MRCLSSFSNAISGLPLFGRSVCPSHCPRLFLSCLSESLNSPFLSPLLLGTHSLQTAVLSEFGMCVADPPLSFCSPFSLSPRSPPLTQTSSATCAPPRSRTPRRTRTTPGGDAVPANRRNCVQDCRFHRLASVPCFSVNAAGRVPV